MSVANVSKIKDKKTEETAITSQERTESTAYETVDGLNQVETGTSAGHWQRVLDAIARYGKRQPKRRSCRSGTMGQDGQGRDVALKMGVRHARRPSGSRWHGGVRVLYRPAGTYRAHTGKTRAGCRARRAEQARERRDGKSGRQREGDVTPQELRRDSYIRRVYINTYG